MIILSYDVGKMILWTVFKKYIFHYSILLKILLKYAFTEKYSAKNSSKEQKFYLHSYIVSHNRPPSLTSFKTAINSSSIYIYVKIKRKGDKLKLNLETAVTLFQNIRDHNFNSKNEKIDFFNHVCKLKKLLSSK